MSTQKLTQYSHNKAKQRLFSFIHKQLGLFKSSVVLGSEEYRHSLLNFTIGFYCIAFMITVPISLMRTFELGLQPINYLHVGLLGVIFILHYRKKELAYNTKVNALILVFYTIGLSADINLGLSAGNYLYFSICILLSASFLTMKKTFWVLVLIVLTQLILMLLTSYGAINYNVSPITQVSNIHFWTTHLTAFITIITSPLIALGWLNASLKTSQENLKESNKALEVAKQKLIHLSQTDELTLLPNRRALFAHANMAFRKFKRKKLVFSILMIDIDHFKKVNDTYGHDAGDLVLKSIAGVLTRQVRDYEIAARSGGEEFVIILQEKNITLATVIAERIRKAIEATEIQYQQQKINITASIGLSQVQTTDTDFEAALKRADINLYKAKNAGRNNVFITPNYKSIC